MRLGPDRISRNEAIEVVGKELFGEAWVGEMPADEWQLTQDHKSRFVTGTRPPIEIADQLYVAEERAARSNRQHGEVIHWLENRGLDCVRGLKDGFDRKVFAAVFTKAFNRVLPSQTRAKYRYPGDDKLVRDAVVALASGAATNPFQAAKLVCQRAAAGLNDQQAAALLDRIRKAVSREWRQATAKNRHS